MAQRQPDALQHVAGHVPLVDRNSRSHQMLGFSHNAESQH